MSSLSTTSFPPFVLLMLCFTLSFQSSHQSHNVISIHSLFPNCSSSKGTKKLSQSPSTLEIHHRHDLCSQPTSSSSDTTKSTQQLLEQDQSRVDTIQAKLSKKSKKQDPFQRKKTTLPVQSGRSLGTGNYVVRVGFGTPKSDLSLVFDTGSDFTWTQCEPCAKACYDQQDPVFNPSNSKSYTNITCDSQLCGPKLRSATSATPGCASSTCVYGIQYGDQSFSVGYFGVETITIGQDVFPNFYFGCGQNNQGLFGKAAGLLGLGRNSLSFVSQTATKYGNAFSYCLPAAASATGLLKFGSSNPYPPAVKFTPMLSRSDGASFYFLDLIGMSVGGYKLGISGSVFATGGTIIDSGTVITRLPPTAYEALRGAFRKAMARYPLGKPASILDTCYDFTGYSTITIPKIGLFFSPGIEVGVDPLGVLIAASVSQVCLAFAPNGDPGDVGIYGNKQQLKLDVIYDVGNSKIGFGPGSCN
ncbi:hypothetical protein Scep_005839 [Stephania cephalantha]|uniref:Peptidase A1 domain-containing protein n=1 Tax=Stephania cephalantha TaxID=152367 RepID=A0AAP0PXV9_9MAGN